MEQRRISTGWELFRGGVPARRSYELTRTIY
jgi:hypothetical protein